MYRFQQSARSLLGPKISQWSTSRAVADRAALMRPWANNSFRSYAAPSTATSESAPPPASLLNANPNSVTQNPPLNQQPQTQPQPQPHRGPSRPLPPRKKVQPRHRRAGISPRSQPAGQVIAHSTAESYDLGALQASLWNAGLLGGGEGRDAVNLMGEAIWVPSWKTGEVFVFENGSFVTWGMTEKDGDEFCREVVRTVGLDSPVEQDAYPEHQTDFLDYLVNEVERTGIRGDTIVIGETILPELPNRSIFSSVSSGGSSSTSPSPSSSVSSTGRPTLANAPPSAANLPTSEESLLARLALSSGLVRSTKLSIYEDQLDEYLENVAPIPDSLMKGSEAPVSKGEIVRRFGILLKFRQSLNLNEENLLDTPEYFWTNPALEGYYTSVCRALDFRPRLSVLNQKINYAFDVQSTLMDLLSTKTSHRLEWIIIVLIAVEIILGLANNASSFIRSKRAENAERALEDPPSTSTTKSEHSESLEARIARLESALKQK